MHGSLLMLLTIANVSSQLHIFFFFNDTATTEIYTLSLHDALPILQLGYSRTIGDAQSTACARHRGLDIAVRCDHCGHYEARSEEHTSELQSQFHLVCRLLLEKKKKKK